MTKLSRSPSFKLAVGGNSEAIITSETTDNTKCNTQTSHLWQRRAVRGAKIIQPSQVVLLRSGPHQRVQQTLPLVALSVRIVVSRFNWGIKKKKQFSEETCFLPLLLRPTLAYRALTGRTESETESSSGSEHCKGSLWSGSAPPPPRAREASKLGCWFQNIKRNKQTKKHNTLFHLSIKLFTLSVVYFFLLKISADPSYTN